MSTSPMVVVDANRAVADVAYRVSEVIAIYPITPASPMGEHADAWATRGRQNVWGAVPRVSELQAEGGAAGAVHGALQAGALATTFTASQGLLLMVPNMFKIAGELSPCVIHVAARSIATHALSIFGDHSDVYAARGTGFAMLASSSVQEAQDMALISHAATLESRVPFLHFFDGFRTSHELSKITPLDDATVSALLSDELVKAHRDRALSPDHPVLRGTAQNPDAFFQAREALNPFYDVTPGIVLKKMQELGKLTGRNYQLMDYDGHPEAERVIVMMGSGAETARATVQHLAAQGERVGAITVRLYRPWQAAAFLEALPATAKRIAVLDRTKEPGAPAEPLHLDVATTLIEAQRVPEVLVGGRYGLSSKELTPAMLAGVFAELKKEAPKNHFTLGINDDVTHLSLSYDDTFNLSMPDTTRAVFWGLGSDGTVSASKSTVQIIGESTEQFAQGYFVYDSKKAGAVTVSHLRFGKTPIHAPYLVNHANFIGVHQWSFIDRYDVLEQATEGATIVLNAPYPPEEVWAQLPAEMQQQILDLKIRLHCIDAYALAREIGLGRRINTIMQTCFFILSEVLPTEEALAKVKDFIQKSYGKRGFEIVKLNNRAVDATAERLAEVPIEGKTAGERLRPPIVSGRAPDFVQRVTGMMLARKGDLLPVSAFKPDGTWPTDTARWEKRAIALEIPVWDADLCIQCNKCALVCPHAAVRAKVFPAAANESAPGSFKAVPFKSKQLPGMDYSIQVAPEDCTGCTLCVEVCPARDKANPRHKALDMHPMEPLREAERENFEHFLSLPEIQRDKVRLDVKHTQLLQPLFEFSGACAGCGETPYIKLITQLFGDRMVIANATGCSSIYGGNLPTTPYAVNADGRGPAWSNSLFEDNAEFGFGMRLAIDQQKKQARDLLTKLAATVGEELAKSILEAPSNDEASIASQRTRVEELKAKLASATEPDAQRLGVLADYLVDKSVWIVGGDGWAYDIGYGGLDHVLASGDNINVLVLDTEVYSNTGGQQSKATPLGAVAKFAAAGKEQPKKDLSLLAMAYGNVYVARIAFGADDKQTLNALLEAESYDGPSIVIAYSPCIAHGYDMAQSLEQQKLAVQSAYWPLFRYDPRKRESGAALKIDSKPPKKSISDFAYNEARFRLLLRSSPERAAQLMEAAQQSATARFALYQQLAAPVASSAPTKGDR